MSEISASTTLQPIQLLFRWLSPRLTISFFVIAFVMMTGARLLRFGAQEDPFAAYRLILPGSVEDGVSDFDCQSTGRSSTRYVFNNPPTPCSIFPKYNALFHLITVDVRDHLVHELTFYSQFLQTDQLMQEWGDPQTIERSANYRSFTFTWDRGSYLARAVTASPLGLTVARLVVLTEK